MIAVGMASTSEAAEAAGVTSRQVDYWARTRIVEPSFPASGSGSRRGWSNVDVAVLGVVGRASAALQHEVHGDVLRRVAAQARSAFSVLAEDIWPDLTINVQLDGMTLSIDPAYDDSCPDDPDGLHHIGCGCETSDVFA